VSRKKIIQAPKGTRDILPNDQPYWEKIRKIARETARDFGFLRIDTPLFEEQELFSRGIGLGTDIIEKEMYAFTTRGKDKMALRPEFTAGVTRAFIEHGLFSIAQPLKLWSLGPIFRYEQPQAGRYRQAYQANFEIFGSSDAVSDVQTIQAGLCFFKKAGLKNVTVHLNSIGCVSCRKDYRKALLEHYRRYRGKICADCRMRLKKNPLRVLDCKNEKCQEVISEAPISIDHLCEGCKNHFKKTLDYLDGLDVSYYLDNHLVRGLDYYNRTVFEYFVSSEKEDDRRQTALGGGGRYDGLVGLLGGKESPAIGMALGLDRLVDEMKRQKVKISEDPAPAVFLVQLGDLAKKKSLKLFEELLKNRIGAAESFSRDSIKSQLKLADKLGAKLALILGQQEALDETIIVREMAGGVQETVPLSKAIQEIKKKLKRMK